MKTISVSDNLQNLSEFVHDRCTHYEHRLKWHDVDIDEIQSNIRTINHLITILFLENIVILLLLIILTW